jgi:hypothetical protein
MVAWRILRRRGGKLDAAKVLSAEQGAALLEFAITLPLLVVFVVGIYDFSGAFNQKQKIEQAAQEGAILVGAQPLSDLVAGSTTTPSNPASLQPVVTAIFNSLAGSGALPYANQGTCTMPPPAPTQPSGGLSWTYTILGCSSSSGSDQLLITINRGWTSGPGSVVAPLVSVGSIVTVTYPYHWRFNSVIQSLMPGANYAAITQLSESSTVQNQL